MAYKWKGRRQSKNIEDRRLEHYNTTPRLPKDRTPLVLGNAKVGFNGVKIPSTGTPKRPVGVPKVSSRKKNKKGK